MWENTVRFAEGSSPRRRAQGLRNGAAVAAGKGWGRWRALARWALAVTLLVCAPVLQAATLLVVGDSISAAYGVPAAKGWVALMETRAKRQVPGIRVVNASVSGDTSAGGLARLPALLRQHKPAIVIIELGGNDGLRGLRLKNTRQNLMQMVKLAQRADAKVLLLGIDLPPSQGAKYVRDFAAMYPAVAKATGAAYLPSFLAKVGVDPDMMQSDGIHPNSLGQPVLVDTVWPALAPMLSALK